MLVNYGYIGLFVVVAIVFTVTTLLLPFSLSLPARLAHLLSQRRRLLLNHPVLYTILFSFLPSIPAKFIPVIPHKPNPVKNSTFECGMETIGKSWVQFNFRYYFYALVFIALDVMVVFLYPWAVELRGVGYFGLVAVVVFILIISVGYVYAWRKKALEWK